MKRHRFRVRVQFQHRANTDFECRIKKLFLEFDQNVSFLCPESRTFCSLTVNRVGVNLEA
jgi:hypothetical protein